MMKELGFRDRNTCSSLTFPDYIGGGFMLTFNLCPDQCAGTMMHRPKHGNVDLILKFQNQIGYLGTLHVVSQFDCTFQLDGERNCDVQHNNSELRTMADALH